MLYWGSYQEEADVLSNIQGMAEGGKGREGNCSFEELQHHFKALLLLHLTRGNNNW